MEDSCKLLLLVSLLAAASLTQGFRVKFAKRGMLRALRGGKGFVEKPNQLFFKDLVPEPVTYVRLGQSLVLDCEAGGSPTPTIHWNFGGSRIIQGTSFRVDDDEAAFEVQPGGLKKPSLRLGATKSKLYIDCLTPEHLGHYECVADIPEKRIVHHTKLVLDDEVDSNIVDTCLMKRIDAGQPARVVMWTVQRLEYQGQDVQLFCRAEGLPAPTVTWFDGKGHEITPERSQYSVLDNGDLLIRQINFKDNMGLYECRVENDHGQDSVKIFLYPTMQ